MYSFKADGLDKASILFILLPSITFLTATSTILPFLVLGMSFTAIILAGTCLGEASYLIVVFSLEINFSSNLLFLDKTTKSIILTSLSQD